MPEVAPRRFLRISRCRAPTTLADGQGWGIPPNCTAPTDSFSYGSVPHAYHFTTVAEREYPGVEIYNTGYSGTGPSDYLYLLEHEALPLDPDLVVVNLFMGNDVADGPAATRRPSHWYDADNYLIAVVWYRLQIMRRAELTKSPEVIEQANLTPEELALQYPRLAEPLLERPFFSREVYFEIEAWMAPVISSPHGDVFVQRFFEALAALERAAEDTPLAFMLIPAAFQVEDEIWEEVVRRTEQPLDRDLAHRTVVEWLECRGRAVLDLLPLLRAVPPMEDGRRHLYHLQDTHFNARGNEVAGRALARFVDSLQSTEPGRPRRCGASQATGESPPAPVSLPLHLDIGDSTAHRWMRSGWNEDEAAGGETLVWSNGVRSVLTVPLPTGGDIRMDFEALPFVFRRSPTQRVSGVTSDCDRVGHTTAVPEPSLFDREVDHVGDNSLASSPPLAGPISGVGERSPRNVAVATPVPETTSGLPAAR